MSKTLVGSAEKYISNPKLPKEIYQDDGLRIHVQRRHPECEQYLSCISDIISNPDTITDAKLAHRIQSNRLRTLVP